MLIEKYEPVNLFDLVPLERDKVLDELDQLLEDDALFQEVKSDLAQRHPHTMTRGRHSTPVEVILRMLVVKHLTAGATKRRRTLSPTASPCASSVGFIGTRCRMTRHSSSGPT
jgi:hypothetical protein